MNIENFLEAVQLFGYFILGGLAIYFKTSMTAQAKANEVQQTIASITATAVIFIKEAEEKYKDATNAGGTKFNEVVDRLYSLVPDALQVIIPREMVENIVQSTFDQIEEYVALQLNNAIDKTNE